MDGQSAPLYLSLRANMSMCHAIPHTNHTLVKCNMLYSPQGDPSAAPYAVENAKAVLGQKPVFGICMGHQILGQAFGGKTFKLKFGHHGGNHPIRHNPSGQVEA
eukprot:GHUV01008141.1.p2 GENE.GHUV01008141.1~~GHUV01008141.1.p2  ORF type:complete len:104 (-),score=13.35 GHUV01008141.1:2242-2553(-)